MACVALAPTSVNAYGATPCGWPADLRPLLFGLAKEADPGESESLARGPRPLQSRVFLRHQIRRLLPENACNLILSHIKERVAAVIANILHGDVVAQQRPLQFL